MLFNATDLAKLPKEFPMGVTFNKKTTKAKNLVSYLQDDVKYGIGALPCYMPIPCSLPITVKGKPDDTQHDHMRGLNSFAHGWLKAMAGNGPGNIAFDHKFQKAVLADSAGLAKIMPKVPKGMKFVDSPHNNNMLAGMCVCVDLQCGTVCLNGAILTGPGFEPIPISRKI